MMASVAGGGGPARCCCPWTQAAKSDALSANTRNRMFACEAPQNSAPCPKKRPAGAVPEPQGGQNQETLDQDEDRDGDPEDRPEEVVLLSGDGTGGVQRVLLERVPSAGGEEQRAASEEPSGDTRPPAPGRHAPS